MKLPNRPTHKNVSINGTCSSSSFDNVENKMYLVLDLDHTLVNSTPIDDLSSEENYLKNLDNLSKRGLFRFENIGVLTKLRPFVRTFLDEASKMFEMYIYTMGDRSYALEMAKLLDPENKLFYSRIISRDDCVLKDQKGLDFLQKPKNSVLVLDDTENVWSNHKDNLILMDRYMYFSSSCRQFGVKCKSLSELRRDEDEADGALSTILQVLKRIFHDYTNTNGVRDVRGILKNVRKRTLRGCKIVFSGIFPTNVEAHKQKLWKMAEELGATCCTVVENDVTHVVTVDLGTEKSRWAVKEGKFLVHPRWVEAAYYLWRRHLEDKFEMAKTVTNKNHLFSLFEDKLNDTNFLDWNQNLRTFLKIERKEYVLDEPLPNVPEENAPRDVHNAFNRHKDDSLEVTCLMLLTMNCKFQKQFEYMEAYDMIQQLKCSFENKTSLKTVNPVLELKSKNFKKICKGKKVNFITKINKHVDGLKNKVKF
ncbi:hypothetical protein RND81_05G163100 [Saponaria officinalis]|uniref:RNA polymerase II C-terminal domain phosphatase-like n=1 Tax=Saponaria officinalis TaxID=3572 RepID=A0AAW1KSW1_SAPOF